MVDSTALNTIVFHPAFINLCFLKVGLGSWDWFNRHNSSIAFFASCTLGRKKNGYYTLLANSFLREKDLLLLPLLYCVFKGALNTKDRVIFPTFCSSGFALWAL